jgi:hypothetical protein
VRRLVPREADALADQVERLLRDHEWLEVRAHCLLLLLLLLLLLVLF